MMKKILLPSLLCAFSTLVCAQSSVTVFGIVDAGLGYLKSTGGGHATGLMNGGNTTSRLGFRGVEDLGGGLAAGFWLEGSVANDVGAGASQTTGFDFARRSTVSLSGPFGEIRLGRDFAASYTLLADFDPWFARGLGSIEVYGDSQSSGPVGTNGTVRVGNAVSYFLPATLGGLYGQAQVSFGERSSTTSPTVGAGGISASSAAAATDKTGNYYGARLGYKRGAWDVSGSVGSFQDAVRQATASAFYADDFNFMNIGAAYDFGLVKVTGLAQKAKMDGRSTAGEFSMNTYLLGASVPVGASLIRASVQRYDVKNSANDSTKLSLGYIYNLSKRTSLYADVSRINNGSAGQYTYVTLGSSLATNTVSAGGNVTGVAVGIKHAF